ncbi:MAG: response regulator [Synechococcaceae cyanobacterium SM2_3_1]|nr:response regulator [Synechococcaceae cyanobacterium SM2_3_1]
MLTKRILIIDDEDDIREVAQISLETMAGWEVLTASSGPEGVKLAEAEQPDLILLDMMMPGMDGPSTLQVLQNNPRTREIPVIILTAKVRARLLDKQYQGLGAVGLITKPFNTIELPDQIAGVIGWS